MSFFIQIETTSISINKVIQISTTPEQRRITVFLNFVAFFSQLDVNVGKQEYKNKEYCQNLKKMGHLITFG